MELDPAAGGRGRVLAALGLRLRRPLMPRAGLFLVESDDADEDGLDVATRLRPKGGLLQIVPDLALRRRAAAIAIPPSDPRYGGQWYLSRIEIEKAWALSTGDASIVVGVVDNGCDLTHPDLVDHLDEGYNAVDPTQSPTYTTQLKGNEHGTACAGIVAAVSDNGRDIAGVCPECRLRCVRLLDAGPVPVSADIDAFRFMLDNDVDVASNSWGFESAMPVPGPLKSAIETYMRDGRGGLGAVVVFAAGNDDATIGDDELQAIPGIITVGAINNFDEAAPFSNRGASVDVTAPAGTLTLDIQGADGASPTDTTNLFGGTSSSAPVVAGVAGLLLAAEPKLTREELVKAVVETARPAPFSTPDDSGHDPLYGYGIIDPTAALSRVLGHVDAGPGDAGADQGLADAGIGGDSPVEHGSSGGCALASSTPVEGGWPLLLLLLLLGLGRSVSEATRAGAWSCRRRRLH